ASAAVPTMTRALPTMTHYPGRPRIRTGWLAVAAAVLVVGLVGGLAIGLGLAQDPSQSQGQTAAQGAACAVNYQITSDDGNTFVANIVATNTGQALPDGWRLTMALPSGQASALRPSGDWQVDGSTVASPAQDPLGGGGAARMTFTARHSKATVLPTGFDIG